mgnify:CR=1 FL=1
MDTGEHRSPKKIPDTTAPPVNSGFTPMADPMVIQTTPMVAAVPKDVPVSTETAQFNKKLSSKKPEGWISPAETAMISGMVPAPLHRAVRIPIRRKINRIRITVPRPDQDILRSEGTEYPFFIP